MVTSVQPNKAMFRLPIIQIFQETIHFSMCIVANMILYVNF